MSRTARLAACAALAIAGVIGFTLLRGGTGLIEDQTELRAIKGEAELLMSEGPAKGWTVPKSQWPPAIARLRPQAVTVEADGVDILTRPFFDGGWGYLIPRHGRAAPEPAGRFSAAGQGVYRYHPY